MQGEPHEPDFSLQARKIFYDSLANSQQETQPKDVCSTEYLFNGEHNKTFGTQDNLTETSNNEKQIINQNRNEQHVKKLRKNTNCYDCGVVFSTRKKFIYHCEKVHPKVYNCPVCSKVMRRERTVRRHMMKHDQGAWLICIKCDFTTARRDNLSIHLMLVHPLVSLTI